VGSITFVGASARVGTFEVFGGTSWDGLPPWNYTVSQSTGDLDGDGRSDEFSVHVLDLAGAPARGRVLVNGTEAGTLNPDTGFLYLELSPGLWNVTLDIEGEPPVSSPVYVPEEGGPAFLSGPDFVLLVVASLSGLVISIFAIVLSFDAVSKERVQGTMDLLLSRPASRTGVLLGKFLASFSAVAIPVTLVNLAGIGVISSASEKAPTGYFAAAFVGYSLLLIAYYALLQLTLSTLAKTSGTAVLFGVLLWLLLNILYSIVTFVVASVFSGGDPATFFRIQQYAGLGNPSSIVGMLISLSAPGGLGVFGAGTTLDAGIVGAAAVAWFLLLFSTALWVFHKRAAQ
jgi:Cu-processing system permease protein